jgi:hypothetical protein
MTDFSVSSSRGLIDTYIRTFRRNTPSPSSGLKTQTHGISTPKTNTGKLFWYISLITYYSTIDESQTADG